MNSWTARRGPTEGVLAPLDAKLPPWKKSPKLHSDIAACVCYFWTKPPRPPPHRRTPTRPRSACATRGSALSPSDNFTATESGQMATTDMQTAKPVSGRRLTDDQLAQERLDEQKAKEQAASKTPSSTMGRTRNGCNAATSCARASSSFSPRWGNFAARVRRPNLPQSPAGS